MSEGPSRRALAARLRAFGQLALARWREFYREPEVVFWSFVFPILLSIGLGIAFRDRPVERLPVAVVGDDAAATLLRERLTGSPLVLLRATSERAAAEQDLRMGRVALLVLPHAAGVEYRFDPSRPESLVARDRVDDLLQRAAGRSDPVATTDAEVAEPGGRYIDFLVPGLIGLNLLSGGLWGVGFHLVDMRLKKLLKRLVATPMRRADFLAAQLVMRLADGVLEASVVLGFAVLAFDVPLRGSLIAVAALVLIGALVFGGLGLLVASRARKIEAVSGLMNLVMMPMFVVSGIFFSYERFPEAVHPLIQALPLTALNDALRAVILEGAGLASQAAPLAVLALWGGLSFVIGLRLFRWQ